jgi:hypothetical protein
MGASPSSDHRSRRQLAACGFLDARERDGAAIELAPRSEIGLDRPIMAGE